MTLSAFSMPVFLEAVRDGKTLAENDIRSFILNLKDFPDEQIGAFLAHAFHKPLSRENTAHLTLAMRDSGTKLDWQGIDKPVVDKHSTGGIGDKITICLAPLLASLGMAVPTIAGRGLGFSGGTVDKLETIPGLSLALGKEQMETQVRATGLAFAMQTENIAPADRKLYATRDVTATVESIPLITASILSKKLSESLDFLLMDVKWGNGAFMQTIDQARALAKSIVSVANTAGVNTQALLTNMNQPLGAVSGNWCETAEAVSLLKSDTFTHQAAPDVLELTLAFAASLLMQTGLIKNYDAALTRAKAELASGKPFEIFCRTIAAQGADPKIFEKPFPTLKGTEHRLEIKAQRGGSIRSIDTKKLGQALVLAGAGRQKSSDPIDGDVSLHHPLKTGENVQNGETLCTLYFNNDKNLALFKPLLENAFQISNETVQPLALVQERIAS